MKQRLSLRLRVTLVCGLLLAACCLLLTLSHNYYAYEMADAIEAIPLQPAVALETAGSPPMEELSLAQSTLPVRRLFRVQSLLAMGVIVAVGCLMVYWLTGKALSPPAPPGRADPQQDRGGSGPAPSRALQRRRGGGPDGLLQPDVPKSQPGLCPAEALFPVRRP